jgi:N,N'-diacetyllegionaminate synthase
VSTTIIAEAGVNHNGDIGLARELIKVAAHAGADYVKFQTFDSNHLASGLAQLVPYQLDIKRQMKNQREMLKDLELTKEQHFQLMQICDENRIKFFSTAFDIPSLGFLKTLGFKMFKIPSGEITNLPFLELIGSFNSEILLSTGMSNLNEIEEALNVLEANGTPRSNVTVLHCTSSYPAPMRDVNLKGMLKIQNQFGVKIGYSDHTLGTEVSVAAVALGATVIEKHFTLSRSMEGPDHKASLEPQELEMLVQSIRNIEQAFGDGEKTIRESELENILEVRKSIVAACDIVAGEVFTEKNLTTMRPGTGISPMRWREILGKKSNRGYTSGEIIQT